MDDKKLLIVGLDPGVTTGYAFLDIDENLIHANSSRQLGLSGLISETIKFGKVLLVGTDKHKVPRLVEEFAAKLGARIASPQEDIGVDEKRSLAKGFDLDDGHQRDALASALFAYKSIKPLLDKVDFFVKENKKHGIKNEIKEMVVAKHISIKSAVGIIEKKEEPDKIMSKALIEKKLEEKDFLKLYGRLKDYERQISYLRNYSNSLKKMAIGLERAQNKENRAKTGNRTSDFRENRIKSLENALKAKERDLEQLRGLLRKFNKILSNINGYYILKKLDNFGAKEFDFKNRLLDIKKNDIILVDDPNIVSGEVIEFLKDKVFVAVKKAPISKKIERDMPFVFIISKSLSIDEDRYFGFVDKKQFEAEKNKIDWVKKIVEDYRNEKLAVR